MCLLHSKFEASVDAALFVQRMVQYEPLLGMATLGLLLKVPVVSMRSILEVHACASREQRLQCNTIIVCRGACR